MAKLSRPAPLATAATIRQLFSVWQQANPTPITELHYSNPFQLLVAVVLSAQTTDIAVNKATAKFFPTVTTPVQLLSMGEVQLIQHIRTIGLFRTKAKNVLQLCQILIKQHAGHVPTQRQQLESLPGVGPKTAAVVLNTLTGAPTIAVDTHVFRVARRLGLSRAATPAKVEADLTRRIPIAYRQHAHHWLILHGRYICTAQRPKCKACPLATWCHAPDKQV